MLTISLTAGTTSNNVPVGFSEIINTNNNVRINNSNVEVLVPGIYEVVGVANVTSTAADDYGLAIYANNELIGIENVNLATGASESTTIPIYATVTIEQSTTSGYVELSIMPVGAPTIVGGILSFKRIN